MNSPNEQYQIAQELSKIECYTNEANYDITGYEINGDYRIAVTAKQGMFSQVYIHNVVKLSQQYGFSFFISDICSAIRCKKLFIIIY